MFLFNPAVTPSPKLVNNDVISVEFSLHFYSISYSLKQRKDDVIFLKVFFIRWLLLAGKGPNRLEKQLCFTT